METRLYKNKLFVGVDGGGTKTHLTVSDENGEIKEFIEVGPTNQQTSDKAEVNFINLFNCLKGEEIEVAVLTLSGWDSQLDYDILNRYVSNALEYNEVKVKKTIIENDVFAVLKSGIGSSWKGVGIVSGTGTISAGINGETLFRTSGMGYGFGEWGSGPDLAVYALHLVFAAHYGRRKSCPILTQKVLKYFRVKNIDILNQKLIADKINHRELGFLVPYVYEAYKEGSNCAKKVLEKGGKELARGACAMLNKIDEENIPVVVGGGVFKNIGLLPGFKETLINLYSKLPEIRIVRSDPVYGSLIWALQIGRGSMEKILDKIDLEIIT